MTRETETEEAVKTYREINGFCEGDSEHHFRNGIAAGVEIGRREVLRSLFVEVKPKEVRPNITYMMLIDGEWHERRVVTVELLKILAMESEKIYRVELPSPSEVFGEGGE